MGMKDDIQNECTVIVVGGGTGGSYVAAALAREGIDFVHLEGEAFTRSDEELKNSANWGYWSGTDTYADDTSSTNSPYFEALTDGSGWAWFIPRYDGTTSIGVVMNQDLADSKKEFCSSIEQFYTTSLKLAPNLSLLLGDGELVTDVKSASDYSYNSSAYAIPYDSNKLTQAELCKTFDFSTYASEPAPAEIRTKTVKKVSFALDDDSDTNTAYEEKKALLHANPIDGEERRSKKIRPRNIMGVEDAMGIDAFKMNLINGLAPGLRRGSLGLPSSPRPLRKPRRYSV